MARCILDDAEAARRETLARRPPIEPGVPTSAGMPVSAACEHAKDRALSEARGLGDQNIGCEHLLLALAQESGSPLADILRRHGPAAERLRAQLRDRPRVREGKSQPASSHACQPAPHPGDCVELDGGIFQVESVSVHREGEYLGLELRLRRTP